MTERITTTMDDRTAALVRAAAERETGGNVSEWLAKAARRAVLAGEARAYAEWDATRPSERADELAEAEAEREARWEREAGRGAA